MLLRKARSPRRRRLFGLVACILALLPALFVVNGMFLARGERPVLGATSHPASQLQSLARVKVLSYNIANGFVYKGRLRFEDRGAMAARMKRIADVINTEQPDLVFLSEAIFECGPYQVNQVETIAQATGMHAWAFGEDFNFGLPLYRIVNGNAILARQPLELIANPSLAGRRPFYIMKNNRRTLWCATQIGDQRVLLASIHADSFNAANNLAQTRQLLDFVSGRPAILAGDFNATPDSPSIALIQGSGQFSGSTAGPMTFPSGAPDRTIDYIFAPAEWELIEHRAIQTDASDHLPVVSVFRFKPE